MAILMTKTITKTMLLIVECCPYEQTTMTETIVTIAITTKTITTIKTDQTTNQY